MHRRSCWLSPLSHVAASSSLALQCVQRCWRSSLPYRCTIWSKLQICLLKRVFMPSHYTRSPILVFSLYEILCLTPLISVQRAICACYTFLHSFALCSVCRQPWRPLGSGSDGAKSWERGEGLGGKLNFPAPKPYDVKCAVPQAPMAGAHSWKRFPRRDRRPGEPNYSNKEFVTNQEQLNKYPCYRIRDTQSL